MTDRRFARIVTNHRGEQMLVHILLGVKGGLPRIRHTMLCGDLQLEFEVECQTFDEAQDLVFNQLNEEHLKEEYMEDPIKTFNELTQGGRRNDYNDNGKLPPITPSLN